MQGRGGGQDDGGQTFPDTGKDSKGKGVSFMEGRNIWHGKAIGDQDYAQAKAELGGER